MDCTDEASKEMTGAVIFVVFAENTKKQSRSEATMDGSPGLTSISGDVVQPEEGFHGVDQILHAKRLVGRDKFSAGVPGADGGSAEFG